MKLLKKAVEALLLLSFMIPLFSGCSGGVRGIDGIAWNEYDELIASIKAESDGQAREALLHQAEDMLMASECVTPLYGYRDTYLQRKTLTGIYPTHYGAKYFMYASSGSGVVSAFLGQSPDSVDPALATTTAALTIVENTFSGLFAHDANGGIFPMLAESYDVSRDGRTYRFKLHEGLLWSDGSALGASDFIYSWRRAADSSTGSPYKYLFDIIALDEDGKLDLTADETDTLLTVKLTDPCDYFTELCAFPAFYPVEENCVESAEGYMDIYENIIDPDAWTLRANYVVSGAFTFSGTADGEHIFKKNANFFDAAKMTTDTLEIIYGTDANAAYEMYSAGKVDYLGLIPSELHDKLAGGDDYRVDDINGSYYLSYNFNASAFRNMKAEDAMMLRRALSLFIDRENITSSITKNGEHVSTSIVPDGISGVNGKYRENTSEHTYPVSDVYGYFSTSTSKNREEAIGIIRSLGLDEDGDGMIDTGKRFTLSYLTTDSATDIAVAQEIQQDLAELGVMMKVSAVEQRVFDFEVSIYNYDIIALGGVSYYDDALSVLERWTTDAAGNYARLGSVVVEEDKNAY